jgi:hypothetical protein
MDDNEPMSGLDVLEQSVESALEEEGPLASVIEDSLEPSRTTPRAPSAAPPRQTQYRDELMRQLQSTTQKLLTPKPEPKNLLEALSRRFVMPTGKSGDLLIARQERAKKEEEEDLKRREAILSILDKQAKLEREQEIDLATARVAEAKAISAAQPKEPAQTQRDRIKANALGLTLQEFYEQERSDKLLLAGRMGGGGKGEKFVNEFQILGDPTATPAQKSAALARLPPDVRKNYATSSKSGASYLDRIEQLQNFTIPDIDEAISMIEASPTLTAGNFAAWLKGKPVIGQKATDLDNALQTIRSAVGFEKLEELKKLSPYGASGLGAVSNAEQKLLQAVKGSLEQDNSSRNLLRNLNRLKDFYNVRVPQMLQNYGIDTRSIREGAAFDMFGRSAEGGESGGTAPPAGGVGGISLDAIRAEKEKRKKTGKP